MFIIWKATEWRSFTNHLNLSGPSRNRKKKNWPGRARAIILYNVSGRARLGPKFQFPFRAGPGSDIILNFSFRMDRARAKILFFTSGRAEIEAMRARPGLKNPARADLNPV